MNILDFTGFSVCHHRPLLKIQLGSFFKGINSDVTLKAVCFIIFKSLKTNFPDFNQGDIAIGAMGNSTIEAVKEAGLRLDITTTPDAPSMAAAIKKFIKKNYPQLEKDDE